MNTEEKYRILRAAVIKMVGVQDTLPELDLMGDMAESLGGDEETKGCIHALIITHADVHGDGCRSTMRETVSTTAGAMRRCTTCGDLRLPRPGELT